MKRIKTSRRGWFLSVSRRITNSWGVDFILNVHYTKQVRQEAPMSKLRMVKRRKVMTFTPVYDLHANILLGYLGDLTLKGALMVSEKPVEIDRNLTLAIEFRKSSEKTARRMTILARVAWCKQEEHRTYYNTGLEFQEMTEQNKKVIEAILEKYQISYEKPR
jgi:hypothetical protein